MREPATGYPERCDVKMKDIPVNMEGGVFAGVSRWTRGL